MLEDDATVGARPADRRAIDKNLTGGWGKKAGDGIQGGGFATARRAEKADELPRLRRDPEISQRRRATISDREIAQFDVSGADCRWTR
ncbi:hypothetical protein SS37A_36280 (plasmid) [Methylocystis iwaonis]|uniref:Uncharacterized protein n=1 Tax=Methylocystis iwaonis TaxID=2885079 RepID=A0ABN6VK15_9HYPH|nr:hypothetical protein SS37A_36280 [Methylocystis iwaonis]